MKPLKAYLGLILIMLAIIGVIAGAFLTYGSDIITTGTTTLYNGRSVTCDTGVTAKLLTGELQLTTPTSCTASGACIVSPANGFSIIGWVTGTDVTGTLLMKVGDKTFDKASVTQNRVLPGSNYELKSCVPKATTSITLQTMNDKGGIDDTHAITIQ